MISFMIMYYGPFLEDKRNKKRRAPTYYPLQIDFRDSELITFFSNACFVLHEYITLKVNFHLLYVCLFNTNTCSVEIVVSLHSATLYR